MGRRIYDTQTGDFIWKYVFAIQDSEQCRIYDELEIGEYEYNEETGLDFLTLTRSDIPALEGYLEQNNFDILKKEFDDLELTHQGVMVIAKDPNTGEISTFSTVDEGKGSRQLMEELKKKGFIQVSCGYGVQCDYEKAMVRFTFDHDFFFLQMIDRFIHYMKRHHDRQTFTFEGE